MSDVIEDLKDQCVKMARAKTANERLGFIQDEFGGITVDDIVIDPPPIPTLSHEVPDKRLIITQLRIKNFKSYATEVVLGPFNKNFTAVVGPNGSGKSNVIDSLLFVFGYRAKKIRGKKVSHLIHKSDQYPDVESCSVTVKFAMIKEQPEVDSYEIIPNTEFVLSRTAFIDDSSYYEMNKKRTPYKDVTKALRKFGIDLEHSRFLILQGEIEAISLMHPVAQNEHETGMLEYIEDIIGSTRYIEPISKFKAKVDGLNVQKNEKLSALSIVEKERQALEAPKNKAIEYLRLENKAVLAKNSLFQCQSYSLEKDLKEIVEGKKKFSEKLDELKTKIAEVKKSKKGQETELEKINSELDTCIKDCEKFKEGYKALERQDVALHEEIKHLKSKRGNIENNLTATNASVEKLKKQLEVFEHETIELESMKQKLNAEKIVEDKKMAEVMDSMQQDTNALQEKKDKSEQKLIKLKKVVDHLKSEMELLQSELNIYLRTDKKEKQALADLVSSVEKAEKSVKEENNLLQKETAQISCLNTELQEIKEQLQSSQEKEVTMSEELKNSRVKYEEARSSLTNFRNRSGVMQAFAREKANGRLTGVYGRLGDLGAIDERYDVAISTACGALEHIVTDTLQTSEECINFLKKNNLGYVTFIPLEKMADYKQYMYMNTNTPEKVPRLFDLIQVKDKDLLPAFYYAVRDTLVAKDLDQATRIALQGTKRHRVVTLKGEVVDQSGTMSGGGGRPSRGRMGQTVVECTHTPEEVSKMSSEVDSLSGVVSGLRKQITNLQEQLAKKSRELSALQLSIKKRQSNYKAYMSSVDMLKAQTAQQNKKINETVVDEDKVNELKEKIEEKKISYEKEAEEASALEQKVSKMQAEILKITKGSLGKVKKNVDQLSKKISEVSQSITKSSVNMKTCKRNLKKAEEKIKLLDSELTKANEMREKLVASRESTVEEARKFLDQQEEVQVQITKLKARRSELKSVLEKVNEQEHQMKMEEVNQRNDLKEWEASETNKRAQVKNIRAKLSKLKLSQVEEDSTVLPTLPPEELEKLSTDRLQNQVVVTETQMEDMKDVQLSTISEYKAKQKLCEEKQEDLDIVVKERNLQNARYEELRKRRIDEFLDGFAKISRKLKEIYQMITLGGDAEMEPVDTFDPFSKGIEYSVRPPKKSWKLMRNLSGGEKTLSSLALVFALHYYRPTPFYVMDEIDAALDVRNVAVVGYFLKERTKNCQFVIVSLRNIMNELSDHLIGIYKTDNCSKNISIMNAGKWFTQDTREH